MTQMQNLVLKKHTLLYPYISYVWEKQAPTFQIWESRGRGCRIQRTNPCFCVAHALTQVDGERVCRFTHAVHSRSNFSARFSSAFCCL